MNDRHEPPVNGRPGRRAPNGSSRQNAAGRTFESVPRLLLRREEAAACLGMSVDSFEAYVQPFIKVVLCGRLVQVPAAELVRWISENAHYVVSEGRAA
jgi:hypothetical protein